ncbi:hypothetical protein Tco_0575846 [Tanacetum coccineum]
MDADESILNDVVNDANQPQDESDQKKDNSIWFKQPLRPKTPDPEWTKDPTADDAPKQTWFNNMLLKGTYRSSVELEYNMEECYRALTDQLDWANPKGNRCPFDMSKPLSLQDKEGHLTIPVKFFFNNDLEYLKAGNTERKYSSSITKTKAARYTLEGTEEMIPRI